MTIPEEAVEAVAKVHYEYVCSDSDWNSTKFKELYRWRALAYLEAALPAIEKEIRAQVAAEIRDELPVQLAETADSPSGWLSDAQVWLPEPDALYERIDLVSDCAGGVCSIDIHHIAEHAAKIAEGENK